MKKYLQYILPLIIGLITFCFLLIYNQRAQLNYNSEGTFLSIKEGIVYYEQAKDVYGFIALVGVILTGTLIAILLIKRKNKYLTMVFICIVILVFLFSKGTASKKRMIGQNEYSLYYKTYVYAELLCVFSFMDCDRAGVIYLYDEIDGCVLESVNVSGVDYIIESASWYPPGSETVYFKNLGIEIENDEWVLPRPLKINKK